MKLALIRHGVTEGNERRLYYGRTDLPLSEEGIRDLVRLRGNGGYPAAARYYTSGMRRTEQTLELLYGPVPHTALPELREMDFGAFEMKSYEQLREDPAYRVWISGDNEANICPGGESGRQLLARARRGVSELLDRGEDAAAVVHGGVIACLMADWFPGASRNRYEWTPRPGCGFQVCFEGGIPMEFRPLPEILSEAY